MKIEYLGHSAFLIKCEDFSVCFDPFKDVGYDIKPVSCDFCVCSHGHFDHSAYSLIKYKTLINEKTDQGISPHNEKSAKAIGDKFRRVRIFHDDEAGALRGVNYATVFRADGLTVCHLGDAGEKFTNEIAEKLGKIDVLFVPVGGRYTIDAFEAKRYVDGINPEIVVPMHYKTQKSVLDISGKSEFLKLFDKESVKNVTSPFEINAENLPEKLTVLNIDDRAF